MTQSEQEPIEQVAVTQEDIDAATAFRRRAGWDAPEDCLAASDWVAEAFARHRIAAASAPLPTRPVSDQEKAGALIEEAARLIAPGEGEAVFYIRVGGPYTQCTVKAAPNVEPKVVIEAAMDVLWKEFGDLDKCPIHRAESAHAGSGEVGELVEKLRALYVWPQSVADHHADTLSPRQIEKLYEVGNAADDAIAALTRQQIQLEELREALEWINGVEIFPISDEHAGAKNGKTLIRVKSCARKALAVSSPVEGV